LEVIMKLSWTFSIAAVVLLMWASLLAQSPQGTITGTITDSQGARVPGVEVIATQVATNLTYKGSSSEDGTYVIPALPVGRYEVNATASGFKTFRTGIQWSLPRLRKSLK